MLGQSLSHSPGLLGSEVEGLVLLISVKLPQVVLLLLGHDNVHTGDGFAHDTDL